MSINSNKHNANNKAIKKYSMNCMDERHKKSSEEENTIFRCKVQEMNSFEMRFER